MRIIFSSCLFFLLFVLTSHSLFSSDQKSITQEKRIFEVDDISYYGSLREIHFYIKEHFKDLKTRVRNGEDYLSLKESFESLKKGALSFEAIQQFDQNERILFLKRELLQEYTKGDKLPMAHQKP